MPIHRRIKTLVKGNNKFDFLDRLLFEIIQVDQ